MDVQASEPGIREVAGQQERLKKAKWHLFLEIL